MTIPQIARLVHVSTATVWRVLNRPDMVVPLLAGRVRKLIEKDGYYAMPQTAAPPASLIGRL